MDESSADRHKRYKKDTTRSAMARANVRSSRTCLQTKPNQDVPDR